MNSSVLSIAFKPSCTKQLIQYSMRERDKPMEIAAREIQMRQKDFYWSLITGVGAVIALSLMTKKNPPYKFCQVLTTGSFWTAGSSLGSITFQTNEIKKIERSGLF